MGLRWDHAADTLNVSRGVKLKGDRPSTQRTFLSVVSAVFDPLGLVAPFTVQARLLLKEIWRIRGQQWDDPLPDAIRESFADWCVDLPNLEHLVVPRSYFSHLVSEVELHMFGDASQDAFCAVAFLRARKHSSETPLVSFVVGKARVAPMKPLSIPKLELQAALLATRLKEKILAALTIHID